MAGRFPSKNPPNGRLTPSNLIPTTTSIPILSNPMPASPSTANACGETDQNYLERIKAREIISEALLQVTRMKPDDPIEFLHSYFDSQCQTKPYERTLTRLRLTDPKHPSFNALLVELYSNFNQLNDDVLLLKGDLFNKLLDNLCNNPPIFGSKEHRATLIALLTLRPHDSVCFNVFKYGVQAVLLAKEFDKTARSLFNALLTTPAGNTNNNDVDRSLCEIVLQSLSDSLSFINKTPNDAYSLHESIVKLSPHHLKSTIEQRWSPSSRLSTSKQRLTLLEFQDLAIPIYLKTIKKIP